MYKIHAFNYRLRGSAIIYRTYVLDMTRRDSDTSEEEEVWYENPKIHIAQGAERGGLG